jgi:hypothetical protein
MLDIRCQVPVQRSNAKGLWTHTSISASISVSVSAVILKCTSDLGFGLCLGLGLGLGRAGQYLGCDDGERGKGY